MRTTRALGLLALSITAASSLSAQLVLRPVPSGRGTAEVTLAYPTGQAPEGFKPLTIKLDYGQPSLRGRALHTDSLVPYDKAWRVGANGLTTLKTEVALDVGGATLPAGTYALFVLPSRTAWTLAFQKNVGQSATQYEMVNDVGRASLRLRTLAEPVESLTMWLIPSMAPGLARGELKFAWGREELSTTWQVKQ